MKSSRIFPVVAALLLASCADLKPQGVFRSSDYQHYEDAVQVEFYWNCSRPDSRTLAIRGVAAYKPSGARIFNPTFTLTGLDRAGKVTSKAAGTTRVPVIGFTDYVPWEVVLPLQGSEATFDLEYEYQFRDYGGGSKTGKGRALPGGSVIPAALNIMHSKVPNACGGRAPGSRPIRGPNSFGSQSY